MCGSGRAHLRFTRQAVIKTRCSPFAGRCADNNSLLRFTRGLDAFYACCFEVCEQRSVPLLPCQIVAATDVFARKKHLEAAEEEEPR